MALYHSYSMNSIHASLAVAQVATILSNSLRRGSYHLHFIVGFPRVYDEVGVERN